ncbi:hypothetical protein HOP50_16g78380 [Chloropicon primus]|uniref:RING-type domain-containing protein n=1 Tax=Chloropicon primus TaxID=1764295 RepID=A0A5B8N0H9_9CHLO|nr:hypothetical protein A3770_16p78080 [Chloropicon primus]UPR04496.1 hypothetical protein HOP50_16g78380 [Chloropicon primus]|eukprot:QDZ25290.1 hypothetical protein A3770_16p78080 [Chloropicon primus]
MCGMSFCRSKKATIVEDPSLRPKGTFNVSDDVFAKAKELVLNGTIAPFEDGIDSDESSDLENCPICCLSYPALNRTKCCSKDICSHCFFCVKTSRYEREDVPSTKPKKLRHLLLANCPFCKCKPFEICFTGAKSIEEKQREREEALRVEEALCRKREEDEQASRSGTEHQGREGSVHDSSSESTSGPPSPGNDHPEAASRALIGKHKPDGHHLNFNWEDSQIVIRNKLCWTCLKTDCLVRTCPLRPGPRDESLSTTEPRGPPLAGLEGDFSLAPGQEGEGGTQRVAIDRLLLNQAILSSMNRNQQENTTRTSPETRDQQSRTSSGSQHTPPIGGFDLMNPFVRTVNLAQ